MNEEQEAVKFNGELSSLGVLRIQRVGALVTCECNHGNGEQNCSHLCSLFGEPQKVEVTEAKKVGRSTQERQIPKVQLILCERTLLFDNFTDRRISQA